MLDSVLKIGHEQIDCEHVQFVSLMNDLRNAIITGKSKVLLDRCFNELLTLASSHFTEEERLMKESGYPQLKEHREEHEIFCRKLLNYKSQLNWRGSITIELMNILTDWFIDHAQKSDVEFINYLRCSG